MQQYYSAHPKQLRAGLSVAQLYLARGETAKVLAILETITSHLYAPGVVATRAALYEKLGDLEGVPEVSNIYIYRPFLGRCFTHV